MIEIIDNQTIKFYPEGHKNCGCIGRKYCQPVTIADETQFQIIGEIVNADPEFSSGLDFYETYLGIELNVEFSGISEEGECDGYIEATATGGSEEFEYSIDGGEFTESGLYENLCEGTYLITVRDSDGHYAARYVKISLRFDCSAVAGSTANDVLEFEDYNILNCYANDFI